VYVLPRRLYYDLVLQVHCHVILLLHGHRLEQQRQQPAGGSPATHRTAQSTKRSYFPGRGNINGFRRPQVNKHLHWRLQVEAKGWAQALAVRSDLPKPLADRRPAAHLHPAPHHDARSCAPGAGIRRGGHSHPTHHSIVACSLDRAPLRPRALARRPRRRTRRHAARHTMLREPEGERWRGDHASFSFV
jgi:hypothetical protein